uniref:Ig-like domain-containing protein n=1 Tax=Amphiprion percula TaxID=161767 RepID=A0A3P8SLY4_AMPPE
RAQEVWFDVSVLRLLSISLMTHNSPTFLTSVRPSIRGSEGDTDDITVTKGGDVTLQCAAEGVPRPAVTWLKDGRPITGQHGAKVLNEGQLLQIKDAKVSDTGRYTCIAVNVAGQADSKHDVSVHVLTATCLMKSQFWLTKLPNWTVMWMETPPPRSPGLKRASQSSLMVHIEFCPMGELFR